MATRRKNRQACPSAGLSGTTLFSVHLHWWATNAAGQKVVAAEVMHLDESDDSFFSSVLTKGQHTRQHFLQT